MSIADQCRATIKKLKKRMCEFMRKDGPAREKLQCAVKGASKVAKDLSTKVRKSSVVAKIKKKMKR